MCICSLVKNWSVFIGLVLFLSACSLIGGTTGEPTATPASTSTIPGLQVVASPACLVAEQEMIRVAQPQGDLVAWSPIGDALIYVASTQESTWNVGDLNTLSAPAFDVPKQLTTLVAGEVSWSPDGGRIAFLGLRRSDDLYTIGLIDPDGSNLRDLFPDEAAHTDDYSSQKAILGWTDERHLRVSVSCGLDCMQRMDFDILSGLSTPVGDPTQRAWDLWSVTIDHPTSIPPGYADLSGQLNWSPDGSSLAYIDDKDRVWIIKLEAGTIYPLEGAQFGNAAETDWSYDSRYLAVRVDQRLLIYTFTCPIAGQ